jgi:dTDP-4-dehydrorhamnose 3,5-epimerase
MDIVRRALKGVYEITLRPIRDERGYFMRSFDEEIFKKHDMRNTWVQENHSYSKKKGIIRGLHFQFTPWSETKLVRCVRGTIYDVFVDLRKDSSSFGKWDYLELSEDNCKIIYIPRGFAHGFCTLSADCHVLYKVDAPYTAGSEGGIIWNDRTLGIQWPVKNPILSRKDSEQMTFDDFRLKYGGLEINYAKEEL